MSATTQRIDIETYLDTDYRPDLEYIDGELRQRNEGSEMVSWRHGEVQIMLGAWFLRHRDEWGIQTAAEARVQVTSERVRIPDVVVDWKGEHPATLVKPPLLVIEVLSPRDTYSELRKRARDYQAMGIQNIWLIDPDSETAQVCEGPMWVEKTRLEVAGTPVYLELHELLGTV